MVEPDLDRLNKYFMIQGIVTLLGVVAGVIVFFGMGVAFISNLFD